MPEPSDINSHESKHRLANIRLTEMEDTNHPHHHHLRYHHSIDINTKEYS